MEKDDRRCGSWRPHDRDGHRIEKEVCSLDYYGMEGCARGIIMGCGARVGLLDDVGVCLCDYCSLVFFELFRMK